MTLAIIIVSALIGACLFKLYAIWAVRRAACPHCLRSLGAWEDDGGAIPAESEYLGRWPFDGGNP